jgi:hypothetical protein
VTAGVSGEGERPWVAALWHSPACGSRQAVTLHGMCTVVSWQGHLNEQGTLWTCLSGQSVCLETSLKKQSITVSSGACHT